jgi:hypothetical protein
MHHTYATVNELSLRVKNPYSYLIAGYQYEFEAYTDRAPSTEINYHIDYSPDNGATWILIPEDDSFPIGSVTLPIDPQLTSVKFRIVAHFSPIIGSDSDLERTIGPFKVLQPASPTDVTASPNTDGTVTLVWTDNSNMESAYQITRDGPDGSKTFYVNNTTEGMGPIRYVDKEMNKYVSTIYVYSIRTVILTSYSLSENILPGVVSVIESKPSRC